MLFISPLTEHALNFEIGYASQNFPPIAGVAVNVAAVIDAAAKQCHYQHLWLRWI